MTSSFAKLRTHVLGKEICAALYALLEDDSYLLEKDVNERSISHRLACHLQREFPTWHVSFRC